MRKTKNAPRWIAAVNFSSKKEYDDAMTKAIKQEGRRGFSRYVRKLIAQTK